MWAVLSAYPDSKGTNIIFPLFNKYSRLYLSSALLMLVRKPGILMKRQLCPDL